MPIIFIKENDPHFDVALRRFKRACEKAGFPTRLRQLEYYEKRTWRRRRKKAAAVKRYQKKLSKSKEAMMRVRDRRIKAFVSERKDQVRETTNE